MSTAAMEALIYITNWYASRSGTLIRIYSAEKPPHVLSKFALDVLVMQVQVSYHISTRLKTRLHQKKKGTLAHSFIVHRVIQDPKFQACGCQTREDEEVSIRPPKLQSV